MTQGHSLQIKIPRRVVIARSVSDVAIHKNGSVSTAYGLLRYALNELKLLTY